LAIHFSSSKKLPFYSKMINYGWIMPRSYNNADNHLEKQQEHLAKNRVKKYPPLQAVDYWLEYTPFYQMCKLFSSAYYKEEGGHGVSIC
jgi:hypothetical protein